MPFIIVCEKSQQLNTRRQFRCIETVYFREDMAQAAAQGIAAQEHIRTWTVEIPEIPMIEMASVADIAAFRK